MTVEDQAETVAFLESEAARLGLPVDTITTHISTVLMAGKRAFKLKRPVRFPYLDFSTASHRLDFCESELLLNRRTAPELYLGVHRITRESDGRLAFDGTGPLVDAVVEMRRFAPPGARVLNSDGIRKRAYGVSAVTHLPQSAYRPEVSLTVYASLRDEACQALSAGCAVIVDAVFDRPSERASIEAAAANTGVTFQGVWLEAPTTGLLVSRIAIRRNDPSDATAEVLLGQVRRDCGDIA